MYRTQSKPFLFAKKILKILDRRTKLLLVITVLLSIFSGILEILVLYLVGNLINNITNANLQINLTDLTLFIITIIFSALIRIISIKLNAFSATEIVLKIGEATFMNTLKNSEYFSIDISEAININSIMVDLLLSQVWIPLLQIITQVAITLGLLAALVFANVSVSIILISSYGLLYFITAKLSSKHIKNLGKIIDNSRLMIIRYIQNSLMLINEINIYKRKKYLNKSYIFHSRKLRTAIANAQITGLMPKLVIEPIGLIGLIIAGYYLLATFDATKTISIMSILALGMQRLLPAIQGIYGNWVPLQSSSPVISGILKMLERERLNIQRALNIALKDNNKKIVIYNPSMVMKDHNENINLFSCNGEINFEIGEITSLTGKSGAGKSTLVSIIEYVLSNDDRFFISVSIQNGKFFYGTAAENICSMNMFDLNFKEEKNKRYYSESLAIAVLNDEKFFDNTKRDTNQWSELLSGGELKRAINARCYYHLLINRNNNKIKFLFLDEPTTGLDKNTELKAINRLKKFAKENNIAILTITHSEILSNSSKYQYVIERSNNSKVTSIIKRN